MVGFECLLSYNTTSSPQTGISDNLKMKWLIRGENFVTFDDFRKKALL